MKKITILGSTGSIGVSTLDVVKNNPSAFDVCALACGRNATLLSEQIRIFKPKLVSMFDEAAAESLKRALGGSSDVEILYGPDGYKEVASFKEASIVVSAMVGAAGLLPTLAAIEAGKNIALANKETLVMAGEVVCERASQKGVRVLPVDSEHSAIFQCLEGHNPKDVKRIILTASGGPFRKLSLEEMEKATPEMALKHPTWRMGDKITIDSASMMNKGFEMIEAKWLFGVSMDRISVYIHPQSIVHSMVEYLDGSMIAQLGRPDMRIPIAYALSYPERLPCRDRGLDLLEAGALEFFEPDYDKYPNLRLAYEAARKGGTQPAVLNGANEVVVRAFLDKKIGFNEMPVVIEKALVRHATLFEPSLADILDADCWAKEEARKIIKEIRH